MLQCVFFRVFMRILGHFCEYSDFHLKAQKIIKLHSVLTRFLAVISINMNYWTLVQSTIEPILIAS